MHARIIIIRKALKVSNKVEPRYNFELLGEMKNTVELRYFELLGETKNTVEPRYFELSGETKNSSK